MTLHDRAHRPPRQAAVASEQCLEPNWDTGPGWRALQAGEPCRRRTLPLSPALRRQILDLMVDRLRDPGSADYRWLHPTARAGEYCGMVNARSAYGGYTGFEFFHVRVDTAGRVTDLTSDPDLSTHACLNAGYPIPAGRP